MQRSHLFWSFMFLCIMAFSLCFVGFGTLEPTTAQQAITPVPSIQEAQAAVFQFIEALKNPDTRVMKAFIAPARWQEVSTAAILVWDVQQPGRFVPTKDFNLDPSCMGPIQRAEIDKILDISPTKQRIVVRTHHPEGSAGIELQVEYQDGRWLITFMDLLDQADPRVG
jgi:hypothetical protein